MQYFLNDTAIGAYSGKVFAKKGDVVTVISEHGNMAIVESGTEMFPVKMDMLSKKEVAQDPTGTQMKQEQQPAFNKLKPGKKTVTNQSNNIQSLF